jgi:hypothetical protein
VWSFESIMTYINESAYMYKYVLEIIMHK